MKYLADANVLSETTKPNPAPKVLAWLREHEPALVIDPIVLGEIWFGILKSPAGAKKLRLLEWFETGVRTFTCVPWTSLTGIRWAHLLADLHRAGTGMPIKDSMIAATALANDLVVVTRNVRDFRLAGVRLYNPYSD